MIDMIYSSSGNFKKGYALECSAPSNIYNNLLYYKKNHENMSHFRVCCVPCAPKDIYKNSISAEEFIKKYSLENLD